MNFWMMALAVLVGMFANQIAWVLVGSTVKWWAAKKRYEEELAMWEQLKAQTEPPVQDTQLDARAEHNYTTESTRPDMN